ncbi:MULTISPECIES: hypothetical protein [unclassified Streptomyces]|uniref:hypothetical protein n=1 Tax=unclassified Streptomyces TaxID=2593676 RepID=UPI00332CDADC
MSVLADAASGVQEGHVQVLDLFRHRIATWTGTCLPAGPTCRADGGHVEPDRCDQQLLTADLARPRCNATATAFTDEHGPWGCVSDRTVRSLRAIGPRPSADAGTWLKAFWPAVICREQQRMTQLCETCWSAGALRKAGNDSEALGSVSPITIGETELPTA